MRSKIKIVLATLLNSLFVFSTIFAHAQESENLDRKSSFFSQNTLAYPDVLQEFERVLKDYSPLEKENAYAVFWYTGGGYKTNSKLWASDLSLNNLTNDEKNFVLTLDESLSELPPSGTITLYRGSPKSVINFGSIGDETILKGFSSTTDSFEEALNTFTFDRLMVIKISSAKSIEKYSMVRSEREFLVPRNTRVKLIHRENKSVIIDGETKIIQFDYLEEVLPPN